MVKMYDVQYVQSKLPQLANHVAKGDIVHIQNKTEKMFLINEKISPRALLDILPTETIDNFLQAFAENRELRTTVAQKQNPDLPEHFVAELVDVLDNMDDTVPFTFKHLEVDFNNNETTKAT